MAGEGKGWISLYRSIQDHWLWQERPFSKGQAWLDLLLLANHKDNKFLLGNELIKVKKGSFITSQKKLMERWGWGSEKTRTFLKLLDSDGMIRFEANKKRTTITIVHYDSYQNQNGSNPYNSRDSEECQNENRTSAERQQNDTRTSAETNNNDNNDNNVNKEREESNKESELDKLSLSQDKAIDLYAYVEKITCHAGILNIGALKLAVSKYGYEYTKAAIDKALECNKLDMRYINGILQNWAREGYPKDKPPLLKHQQKQKGNFNNFEQRKYDYNKLEDLILGREQYVEGESLIKED